MLLFSQVLLFEIAFKKTNKMVSIGEEQLVFMIGCSVTGTCLCAVAVAGKAFGEVLPTDFWLYGSGEGF